MTTALLLLAVLVLVLLNGFFVAAEFAFVRARKPHLEREAEEGMRGARLALEIAEDLGRTAVATIVEDVLGTSVSHNVSLAISLFIAYLITTSLHITIGEQVPKIWAIQNGERVARLVARPLHVFTKVFR